MRSYAQTCRYIVDQNWSDYPDTRGVVMTSWKAINWLRQLVVSPYYFALHVDGKHKIHYGALHLDARGCTSSAL